MTSAGTGAVTIEVELCGKLADLQSRSISIPVPGEGCTAAEILARAAESFPALSPMLVPGRVRVCVNETVVSESAPVSPADRVALFPPVSGG